MMSLKLVQVDRAFLGLMSWCHPKQSNEETATRESTTKQQHEPVAELLPAVAVIVIAYH
jgi:hypothetical protein